MTTHELKIAPGYFAAVLDGTKPFEVRKNDRGYLTGDVIELREWTPILGYSGRAVRAWISCVLGPTTRQLRELLVADAVVLGLEVGTMLYQPEPGATWEQVGR